jgi:hypothetical protein
LIIVINAQPIRVRLENDRAAGITRRDGIAVGLKADPELAIGTDSEHPADIK